MKKKWFDDWKIEYSHFNRSDEEFWTKITVKLPNSKSGVNIVNFRRTKDHRLIWLIQVLDSALTELSKKK